MAPDFRTVLLNLFQYVYFLIYIFGDLIIVQRPTERLSSVFISTHLPVLLKHFMTDNLMVK